MIVPLTGVPNQQYLTVSLTNVVASGGGAGGIGSARVGLLAGDVSQNRVVSLADLALVNVQLARLVTAANYLKDVECKRHPVGCGQGDCQRQPDKVVAYALMS